MPDNQIIKPASGDKSWETTDVSGVKISAPADWEKKGPLSPGTDAVVYRFQTPFNDFGTRGGVQVTTLPKRKMPAKELVKSITSQVEATIGAKDVKTTHIVWPGAKDAWYMSYVAYVPNEDSETAPHPAQVIVADLADGGQTQLTVTALKKDFEPQHMREILQTLKITESGGGKTS